MMQYPLWNRDILACELLELTLCFILSTPFDDCFVFIFYLIFAARQSRIFVRTLQKAPRMERG